MTAHLRLRFTLDFFAWQVAAENLAERLPEVLSQGVVLRL